MTQNLLQHVDAELTLTSCICVFVYFGCCVCVCKSLSVHFVVGCNLSVKLFVILSNVFQIIWQIIVCMFFFNMYYEVLQQLHIMAVIGIHWTCGFAQTKTGLNTFTVCESVMLTRVG